MKMHWFFAAAAIASAAVQGPYLTFSKYAAGALGSQTLAITAGKDGALWYTQANRSVIGRLSTAGVDSVFSVPDVPGSLTTGPDGAIWFTEPAAHRLGRLASNGTVTEYAVPANSITAGPDGAVWFTEGDRVGRIDSSGGVTEYALPTANAGANLIAAGPDGALWFVETNGNKLGRITTGGTITEYVVSMPVNWLQTKHLISAPDGALWFNESIGKIGRISLSGVVSEYPIPGLGLGEGPSDITVGPDGALWFPEGNEISEGVLGRITTDGVVTQYSAIDFILGDSSIVTGPDGALWFTSGFTSDYPSGPGFTSYIVRAVPRPGLAIVNETLPAGYAGLPYSAALAAHGGTAPYHWSIVAGSLPSGLNLNVNTGAIAGTPAFPSNSGFTVQVTDSSASPPSISQTFALAIGATVTPTPWRLTIDNEGSLTQKLTIQINNTQALSLLDILVNNALDGRGACYLAFVPSSAASGAVYLVNDAGGAGGPFAGAMTVPGLGSVSNGQCTVHGDFMFDGEFGYTSILTLTVTFAPSFAGNKLVYVAAQNPAVNSGWQLMGTVNVPGSVASGPFVVGMNPSQTGGNDFTYTFTFSDSNGFRDLAVIDVLVNSAIDGAKACYAAFVPASATTGTIYLVDDAGDAGGPFAGTFGLPSAGTASNSHCTILGAGSSVSGVGNILTLTLHIHFDPNNFTGTKAFFVAARSNAASSGWQPVGSVQP